MAAALYHNPVTLDTTTDPLLNLVRAYEAEVVAFDADDHRPDDVLDALWWRLADKTPVCASDEGAFAALALVARELQHAQPSELTDAVLQSVMDYAHRRQCDA